MEVSVFFSLDQGFSTFGLKAMLRSKNKMVKPLKKASILPIRHYLISSFARLGGSGGQLSHHESRRVNHWSNPDRHFCECLVDQNVTVIKRWLEDILHIWRKLRSFARPDRFLRIRFPGFHRIRFNGFSRIRPGTFRSCSSRDRPLWRCSFWHRLKRSHRFWTATFSSGSNWGKPIGRRFWCRHFWLAIKLDLIDFVTPDNQNQKSNCSNKVCSNNVCSNLKKVRQLTNLSYE